MQLELVGCDFNAGRLRVERHEIARIRVSRVAASNVADGAFTHITAPGEETNLIV